MNKNNTIIYCHIYVTEFNSALIKVYGSVDAIKLFLVESWSWVEHYKS